MSEKFNELIQTIMGTYIVPYEILNATNANAAHAEFLQDDGLMRPNYQYQVFGEQALQNVRTSSKVLRDAKRAELSAAEYELIKLYADYNLAANNFVMLNTACRMYHGVIPDALRSAYDRCNYTLYGEIDIEIGADLLSQELAQISGPLKGIDAEMRQWLYERCEELLSHSGNKKLYEPNEATKQRFGELLRGYFAPYLAEIPQGKAEFTPAEVVDLLNRCLGQHQTSYQAILDENAGILSVSQLKHHMRVPAHPIKPTYSLVEVVSKILGHEFGDHTLRAINAERCKTSCFATGIPGYEQFEEGLALCIEEALGGDGKGRGGEYYVNIALVAFCDFDFRELFEARKWLNFLKNLRPDMSSEERNDDLAICINNALNQTRRATRGTGILPNNKDLMYYAMRERVWRFIEKYLNEDKETELMKLLFESGKTNPLQHEQIIAAFQAGEFD